MRNTHSLLAGGLTQKFSAHVLGLSVENFQQAHGHVCEIHYSGKIITQKVWTSAERCGRDPSRKPTFVGMFERHYSQMTRKVHLAKNASKMHL
jgi:hypothetical protein